MGDKEAEDDKWIAHDGWSYSSPGTFVFGVPLGHNSLFIDPRYFLKFFLKINFNIFIFLYQNNYFYHFLNKNYKIIYFYFLYKIFLLFFPLVSITSTILSLSIPLFFYPLVADYIARQPSFS
jgi:hypothetical protein